MVHSHPRGHVVIEHWKNHPYTDIIFYMRRHNMLQQVMACTGHRLMQQSMGTDRQSRTQDIRQWRRIQLSQVTRSECEISECGSLWWWIFNRIRKAMGVFRTVEAMVTRSHLCTAMTPAGYRRVHYVLINILVERSWICILFPTYSKRRKRKEKESSYQRTWGVPKNPPAPIKLMKSYIQQNSAERKKTRTM